MTIKLLTAAAAGFTALLGASAFAAATLSQEISLCAVAIDEEGLATMSEYRTEFVRTRGASAKRHTLELIPRADGDVLTAECKIRRGKVQEVALKS